MTQVCYMNFDSISYLYNYYIIQTRTIKLVDLVKYGNQQFITNYIILRLWTLELLLLSYNTIVVTDRPILVVVYYIILVALYIKEVPMICEASHLQMNGHCHQYNDCTLCAWTGHPMFRLSPIIIIIELCCR